MSKAISPAAVAADRVQYVSSAFGLEGSSHGQPPYLAAQYPWPTLRMFRPQTLLLNFTLPALTVRLAAAFPRFNSQEYGVALRYLLRRTGTGRVSSPLTARLRYSNVRRTYPAMFPFVMHRLIACSELRETTMGFFLSA